MTGALEGGRANLPDTSISSAQLLLDAQLVSLSPPNMHGRRLPPQGLALRCCSWLQDAWQEDWLSLLSVGYVYPGPTPITRPSFQQVLGASPVPLPTSVQPFGFSLLSGTLDATASWRTFVFLIFQGGLG